MTRCRRRGGAATIYSKAHKIAASIYQSALAKLACHTWFLVGQSLVIQISRSTLNALP
jgi:hypothetical protein